MEYKHWYLTIAIVLIIGYLAGAKYPGTGQAALSKVGL